MGSKFVRLPLNAPYLGIWLFLVIAITIPWFVPLYWTMIATEILIMGLFAMSFNLLFGYGGLLSFGQAGFFGVGAYTAAIMLTKGVESYFLILLVSATISLVVSLIVGFFCVRRDEIFFAMLSLGFGMMLFTVAHNWLEVTGGSDGLPVSTIPPLKAVFFEMSLFNPLNGYYFVLFLVFLSIVFLRVITNSHFGLILRASKENKERLAFSGGNVALIRLVAFVIAGSLSGVAGTLFCIYNRMATPDMLHWSFSARPVLMSILGGSTLFWGPLFGSVVFFILEQIVTDITQNWLFVLGAILIPVVIFFPEGVFGTALKLLRRFWDGRIKE